MKRSYSSNYASNKRFKSQKVPVYQKRASRSVPTATRTAMQRAIASARETKMSSFASSEVGLTTLVTTNQVYNWNYPASGSDSNQRVGNKVSPTGASLRMVLRNNSSQTILCRVIVFKVLAGTSKSNQEVWDNLLEQSDGTDGPPSATLGNFIRKVNRESFKVLKDDVLTLGYETAGYSSPNPRAVIYKNYFKLSGTDVFHDKGFEPPVNNRLCWAVLPLRADGDESTGESLEMSFACDYYYKD